MKLILTLVTLAAATLGARAQTAAAGAAKPPAPPPGAYDQWEDRTKNPVNWLSWGADLRLRNEYVDNAIALNDGVVRHEQDYFRVRERLWASVLPVTNFSVSARVAAEQRDWMKPTYASQYANRSGLEERYGILDNVNVKWNNIGDLPLSLTAGRQDIMLGDPLNWWLVSDGTPGDGSWTFFLDSLRLGYDAKEIKTKFDVIYIYQNALPDELIPTLGRSGNNYPPGSAAVKPYYLTEQNERGVIVYASNKSLKNAQIDGYFIYKEDSPEPAIRSPYGTALGDRADIYTLGAKVTGTPAEHWKYSVEGAYQFGHKQDPTVRYPVDVSGENREINAFGVNAKLSYLVKDKRNQQLHLIYECLSGDDPATTGKDEMFDVLWGRWPRWSELYIYSYINETGGKVAQLNNTHRIGAAWNFDPMKNMTFSATYNALLADQKVPTRGFLSQQAQFSHDGIFRGHYLQTVLKHQFNKHISGHLWGEFVWMGDYYAQRDLMTFLRAEMMFTF